MRRYATFFLTAVMTFGLVVLLLSRARRPHNAPAEVIEAKPDAALDAGATDAGPTADAAIVDAGPPKPTERPLRVATLGWELAAPVTQVDGGAVEVAPEAQLDAVEARLARGGADPAGADVAILPLPAFVASYERIRALDPRVFLVVGFSHGREEVHAAPGALTKAPAADAEVKLVAPAQGTPGAESATVLGLFALDLLGVAPSRVHVSAAGSDAAKGANVAAVVRGTADDRKLAFSTADAARFVPLVAIAPKAALDASESKLRAFAKDWLDALGRAGKDVPGVARRLASKEGLPLAAGVGGAPEAIALVERLGQIEVVAPDAETTLFGKSPVALETLLPKTWLLARGGGLTATAAPDPLPIDSRIAASVGTPAPVRPHADGNADAGLGPVPQGATPLVLYRAPADSTADTVVVQIGFLAGVFDRAAFRVSAKGGEKAARAIATQAQGRFELPASRLAVGTGEPAGAFATVEILALP